MRIVEPHARCARRRPRRQGNAHRLAANAEELRTVIEGKAVDATGRHATAQTASLVKQGHLMASLLQAAASRSPG
jgi:hypothetical protein